MLYLVLLVRCWNWFDSNDEEIERLLNTRDKLRKKCLGDSSERVKQQYNRMRKQSRSNLRQMFNSWWDSKA